MGPSSGQDASGAMTYLGSMLANAISGGSGECGGDIPAAARAWIAWPRLDRLANARSWFSREDCSAARDRTIRHPRVAGHDVVAYRELLSSTSASKSVRKYAFATRIPTVTRPPTRSQRNPPACPFRAWKRSKGIIPTDISPKLAAGCGQAFFIATACDRCPCAIVRGNSVSAHASRAGLDVFYRHGGFPRQMKPAAPRGESKGVGSIRSTWPAIKRALKENSSSCMSFTAHADGHHQVRRLWQRWSRSWPATSSFGPNGWLFYQLASIISLAWPGLLDHIPEARRPEMLDERRA